MAALLTEPQGTSMKRVAMASFVGSAIEYYDFYIYGTAAALVFPKVFFPHLGATLATVASMATFAAAFLSRPVGAAFFGHFGDRLGRQRARAKFSVSASTIGRHTGSGRSWPMPSTTTNRAPGMALARLRPLRGRTIGSSVPWMTIVGAVMLRV